MQRQRVGLRFFLEHHIPELSPSLPCSEGHVCGQPLVLVEGHGPKSRDSEGGTAEPLPTTRRSPIPIHSHPSCWLGDHPALTKARAPLILVDALQMPWRRNPSHARCYVTVPFVI